MTATRPGRLPRPAEKSRALGNPGHRAGLSAPASTEVAALVAAPPPGLGDEGARVWSAVLQAAPWVAQSDMVLLQTLCEKLDRRARVLAELVDAPLTLETATGYTYPHPLLGVAGRLETEILKMLAHLGLTPAERTRLGVAEVKAQSKLEELRARRSRAAG